jgi:hypothetical protein
MNGRRRLQAVVPLVSLAIALLLAIALGDDRATSTPLTDDPPDTRHVLYIPHLGELTHGAQHLAGSCPEALAASDPKRKIAFQFGTYGGTFVDHITVAWGMTASPDLTLYDDRSYVVSRYESSLTARDRQLFCGRASAEAYAVVAARLAEIRFDELQPWYGFTSYFADFPRTYIYGNFDGTPYRVGVQGLFFLESQVPPTADPAWDRLVALSRFLTEIRAVPPTMQAEPEQRYQHEVTVLVEGYRGGGTMDVPAWPFPLKLGDGKRVALDGRIAADMWASVHAAASQRGFLREFGTAATYLDTESGDIQPWLVGVREDVPGGPVFLPPELYVKEYGARESAP